MISLSHESIGFLLFYIILVHLVFIKIIKMIESEVGF